MNGSSCLLFAVPVRYLVAQTGSHTQLSGCFLNGIQTAVDGTKAGVMIKYCGYTVFNCINIGSHCTLLCLLQCQMAVNIPPHTVQNIQETVGIVSVNAQSPCHGTVDMFMCINESRHNHAALCINKLRIRIFSLHILISTCLFNLSTFQYYCSVFIEGMFCIPCYQTSVANQLH